MATRLFSGWPNPFTPQRVRAFLSPLPMLGRNRDYQRYIIISKGRSGSTMLMKRLDSHPHVAGVGEIFHPDGLLWHGTRLWVPRAMRGPHNRMLEQLRQRDPIAYAELLAWGAKPWQVRTAGFKILWDQLYAMPEAQRQALLAVPGLRIILLERGDALGQFVSIILANKHQLLHVPVGTQRPKMPHVRVDPAEFATFVQQRRLSTAHVRQEIRHLPSLPLTYEQLVADPVGENARLCAFLGIEDRPLRDGLQKVSATPLSERIENIAELRAAFAGTDLARYLTLAGIGDG